MDVSVYPAWISDYDQRFVTQVKQNNPEKDMSPVLFDDGFNFTVFAQENFDEMHFEDTTKPFHHLLISNPLSDFIITIRMLSGKHNTHSGQQIIPSR